MSAERWLPVPGYQGYYEVSDHGRVRAVDRVIRRGDQIQHRRGRLKAGGPNAGGYPVVPLHRDGTRINAPVHRLVLEAFVGPCPDGMYCCHNDGNKLNNRLDNLRWDTPSSNALDRVKHGTDVGARKTHCLRGHPFDEENTYLYRGSRNCRKCRHEQGVRWRVEHT